MSQQPTGAESGIAEERTEPADTLDRETRMRLAEDRTVLANERTYTAWIRTGLAALATGVGFQQFVRDSIPEWSVRGIAALLIVFSLCAFFLGAWHYTHLGLKLQEADIQRLPIRTLVTLSAGLCVAAPELVLPNWPPYDGNFPLPPRAEAAR